MKNENLDAIQKNNMNFQEILMLFICVISVFILYYRSFFGTEFTDEAYYVSDALEMLQGNLPYAYNFFAYATGSAFLLIPFLYVYGLFFPNYEGVFLYSRLCYLTFYFVVLICIYFILRSHFKRENVLTALTTLIMFPSVLNLYNFSYNTVSKALSLLIAVLLYDAIERENRNSKWKLIISGLLMGITVLAHPGYGIVLLIFFAIIICRSQGIKKTVNFLYFCAGGLIEVLVVFLPIVMQVGVKKLIEGFDSMFNPYPYEHLSSRPAISKIIEVYNIVKPMAIQMTSIICFVAFVGFIIKQKTKRKISRIDIYKFAVILSMLELLVYIYIGSSELRAIQWNLGLCISLCVIILIPIALIERCTIFLYVAIYPVVFAPTLMLALDRSDGASRYGTAVPAVVAIILMMLNSNAKYIRKITCIYVVMLTVILGMVNFGYIYRDEDFSALTTKVQAGVYKGIYTTEQRAKDVVELEDYLNTLVGEDDLYAYRDNVPCAYLMTHKGTMCEQATWDMLQYSYMRNAPANLYNYYKRRDMIPTVIIYIDYGRDEKLSIDADWVRYNDFVNEYYKLAEDFKLNETFYHIKVYKYSGGFEGNYDEWIDNYKELVRLEE